MVKSGKAVIVVDSVEKAVKFYTEKLAFDLIDLAAGKEGEHFLSYAQLRKGKCFLIVRVPHVEELAEFSMIKRCTGRGTGIHIELKKGIEEYFDRCRKKNVIIVQELKDQSWGEQTFVVKDPHGVRITVAQPLEKFVPANPHDFCGLKVAGHGDAQVEEMIKWLKGFGILRRVSKKFSKAWLKIRPKK